VRLPGLALAVYLLRGPIVRVIESQFDILAITRFVIDVLSTPLTRLASGLASFGVLLLVVAVAKRFRPAMAYLIVLIGAGMMVALLFVAGVISQRRGIVVWLIVALNLMPGPVFDWAKRSARAWNTLMVAGVAMVELLFAREYWLWLRSRPTEDGWGKGRSAWSGAATVPGLLLASLALAVLIQGNGLLSFEQVLRLSRDATVVERGQSFNGLALDETGMYLYATGHTLPYLRRYDLRDLAAPPLQSRVSTGGAQGLAYDPDAGQVYAFNTFTHQLVYLDATTLDQQQVIDVRGLSPGDPWLAVDTHTDTVTIVSEADVQVGAPLIVLDRTSRQVVGEAPLDAGNLLKHPSQPWLYLSFFRRRNEVVLYNLETRSITHTAIADPQAERMVYWKARNELLVTSPIESRIMRFGADRLEQKGYIPAPFGARAIALDEPRQLLLCGNLATGYLEIIDLRSGARLNRHYLGPWLRTIQLRVEKGIAYVSSNGALYALKYASPLSDPTTSRADPSERER
jgi:hypothetical protein